MTLARTAAIACLATVLAQPSLAQADAYERNLWGLSQWFSFQSAFALARVRPGGVQEIAVAPDGEWMVIDDSTVATSDDFPYLAEIYVDWYRYLGREIDAVAVSPGGGVVVSAEDLLYVSHSGIWNRSRLYSQLDALRDADIRIDDVVFDPDGYGWVIAAGQHTVAYAVDDALDDALADAAAGQRAVKQVAMGDDDSFALVAGDWFHLHDVTWGLHGALGSWQQSSQSIDQVVFGPGGAQVAWSGHTYSRPADLLEQLEGDLFMGQNIWQRMDALGVPGVSIAIIDNGEIVAARSYGYRDADRLLPLTPSTPIDAASLSKAVTAAGMLTVVDDGLVGLDEDLVGSIIPKMDWADALKGYRWLQETWNQASTLPLGITPRRLLNHTAGMNYNSGSPTDLASRGDVAVFDLLMGSQCNPALQSCFTGGSAWHMPAVAPGTAYNYSAAGYLFAQGIIEGVTDLDMEDALADRVLAPFGMNNSTFDTTWAANSPDVVALHHDDNGNAVTGGERSVYRWLGAGGLWSTPTDIAQFLVTLSDGGIAASGLRVLESSSVAAMMTGSTARSTYGLGLRRTPTNTRAVPGRPVEIWHSGSHRESLSGGRSWGINHLMRYRFSTDEGIVIMTTGGSRGLMDVDMDGGLEPAAEILRDEVEDRFEVLWGWPANRNFDG